MDFDYVDAGNYAQRKDDGSVAIIDGDQIAYRCAATSETRSIRATHKENGVVRRAKNITNFRKWLEVQIKSGKDWVEDDFDIENVQHPKPVSHLYHSITNMIDDLHVRAGCDDVLVLIQGDGNFRDELPLPEKYKGNRDNSIKPLYLSKAKQYIVEKFPHELAHNREADDLSAEHAYNGYRKGLKVVQVTTDKDAMQCVGWVYNWDKMHYPERLDASLGELFLDKKKVTGWGRKFLYFQILFGDPVDHYRPNHISGKRFGEVSAYNTLKDCETDKGCWQAIYDKYKEWYPDITTYTSWTGEEIKATTLDILQMYVDCAHMRRWEDDQLDVRKLFDRLGIDIG